MSTPSPTPEPAVPVIPITADGNEGMIAFLLIVIFVTLIIAAGKRK